VVFWLLPIGVAALVVLALWLKPSPPPPPPTPPAEPVCNQYQGELTQLLEARIRADYNTIVTLADIYLNRRPCDEARASLIDLRYGATVERAFQTARSGSGGSRADHAALQAYREAAYFADQYDLAQVKRAPAALAVAQRGYEAGAWEFAQGAFQDAWEQKVVGQTNFDGLNLYYAILVNLGLARSSEGAWSPDETDTPRNKGRQLLCDADELARAVHLPRGEARQYLGDMFGSVVCGPGSNSDPVLRGIRAA
jgi:hypothetical protein